MTTKTPETEKPEVLKIFEPKIKIGLDVADSGYHPFYWNGEDFKETPPDGQAEFRPGDLESELIQIQKDPSFEDFKERVYVEKFQYIQDEDPEAEPGEVDGVADLDLTGTEQKIVDKYLN